MSRLHLHIAVEHLDTNMGVYSALFGCEPTETKPDYAKWELADPAVNFAISTRGNKPGLDHVGIQADDASQLQSIRQRLEQADIRGMAQEGATCCYARTDKYWTTDPQGIAWESFHTLESVAIFGERPAAEQTGGACCTPDLSSCC